jgi:6-pyruvoyltetrahydropterin/6-carboxytetrahydropterin synthase
MKTRLTCSKVYSDLPFAHRQPNHDGHCAHIHGHNWSFKFTFEADTIDECGFVVDFGKLKWLKKFIDCNFDHTTVLNSSDPHLEHIRSALEPDGLITIVTVPDCSSEGLASFLLDTVNVVIAQKTCGRVRVKSVEVIEDNKNSATATHA